jgi:general secretion pathway protein L
LAIKELRAPRSGIALSIPREWVMVRTAEFPITVKNDITDVIGYELDRLTPFSPENAYYDFKMLGEEAGKLNLILIAARADLIDRYLEAMRNENIFVERVTINLSSLGTLCAYTDESPTIICLEADAFGYEGGIIRNNTVSSSFWGSFSEIDEKSRADTVAGAVNPLLEDARKQGISPPVILVSTKGAFNDALKQRINGSVTVLSGADTKLRFLADRSDISGNAVGAALESLWPKARGFNILGKGARRKVKKEIAVTIILIFLLLAAWVPYIALPLQREEKRLAEINRQIGLRKEEVRKVEALKKEVDALNDETSAIRDFKETKPMALVILKDLTAILPKDTWLTRTRIAETTVEIEGYAASASEILPKLEQSKYLKKVEFAQPTIRDPKMAADRFVIKMEIEGFAKEEGEKPKDGKKK